MTTIIVIPDSFKGTITSTKACNIIKKAFNDSLPSAKVLAFPIADGGEGTLDCFAYIKNGTFISVDTKNALMKDISASYVAFEDTAVIETASTAGFSLYREFSDPINTTTYGLGLLVRDALTRGYKNIIIGLGGSCTNDAGAGLASALGVKFYDSDRQSFIPVGGTLSQVTKIDISEAAELLNGVNLIGMCDVTNPMYGENGAAHIFAPQKGASPEDVLFLDQQLKTFSDTIEKNLKKNVSNIPGSGAAGAMGAGILAFLNGRLVSGIDILLDMIDFKNLLHETDYIITGEGRFDSQSLSGKVVSGISTVAKASNVPTLVVTGCIGKDLPELEPYGISQVFKTNKINFHKPHDEICRQAEVALQQKMVDVIKYIEERI